MDIAALVLDDDAASARAIGSLLGQLGCRTTICTEPGAAVALALDSGVDLVSADIRMPALDGYDVLALIRSHEHSRRAPSVPVIAITGEVGLEHKAEAIASGFAAHLGKPVRLDELRAVLDRVAMLRTAMNRARYTSDQATIRQRLDPLLLPGADASQAMAGLALAMEQQGHALLRQMLESAYRHDASGAADAARRLADAADGIGGTQLAALCRSFIAALPGTPQDAGWQVEQLAVLARAELDRIVFTLRERVLR